MIIRPLVLLFLLLAFNVAYSSVTICTWNLKDFGKSKSAAEIAFIADVVKDFDVVAIQEVVAGYGGPQAVARLVVELQTKGSKWDYTISNPTSSSGKSAERYAFIWKTSKLTRKGSAWLEKKYEHEMDREPFYLTLTAKGKSFTLASFHAITKKRQPETELKYFRFIAASFATQALVFVGDFNLSQSHSVFNPLRKMGYRPALVNQKTSLRQKCINNDCLASEFDNVFFNTDKCRIKKSGVIHFYKQLQSLSDARLISDHLPVFAELELL